MMVRASGAIRIVVNDQEMEQLHEEIEEVHGKDGRAQSNEDPNGKEQREKQQRKIKQEKQGMNEDDE